MSDTLPPWLPPLFALLGRISPRAAASLAQRLLTRPVSQNPPQDWELEKGPVPAGTRVLASGIHVREWGEQGPVILAQHGWRGRTTQFRVLAEGLVQRGFRVVAVEGPGHGLTPGSRSTPRRLADNLLAVAREFGEVAGVIGHSLGGAAAGIAVELGLATPRLVLIGSPTHVSRLVWAFADSLRLPPAAQAELRRSIDQLAGRPAEQLDLVPLAARLPARCLVVHDLDDDIVSVEEARELLAAWPGAESLLTSGFGHRELLAAPEVVERVIAFITAPAAP